MKLYKVGGCVRDQLMGMEPHDIDWLVVGATPEDMLSQGFIRVGADFPVFLHPKTKDEYALARKERKTSSGHKGFETLFDPSVTLEEDLSRRDLTINAMAIDALTHEISDPHGGRRDLELGVLRHVSEAFSEDPLRVLRLARFQARTGFSIDPSTMALCRSLCASGALLELSNERVCTELRKLLACTAPSQGLSSLMSMGALASIDPLWPERLAPAQLGALSEAKLQGVPEWGLAHLAACQGFDPEQARLFLARLRFPSDTARWSSRLCVFVHWAKSLETGPEDAEAGARVAEQCGASRFSDTERSCFWTIARAELDAAGTSPLAVSRARDGLAAAEAIGVADLTAALESPKNDLPQAVKRAKISAFANAWGAGGLASESGRPPRRPK